MGESDGEMYVAADPDSVVVAGCCYFDRFSWWHLWCLMVRIQGVIHASLAPAEYNFMYENINAG